MRLHYSLHTSFKTVTRFLLIATLVFTFPLSSASQRTRIFMDNIYSVRLTVDGNEDVWPVIEKGSGQVIEVSFDDLTHEYRRYTYKLEHCDFDWKPTKDLFDSEYLRSPGNEEVIDDYEPSLNTTVLYNHYRFTVPNEWMEPLLSGNYRISVMTEDDDSGEEVTAFVAYFSILDPKVIINATMSTNTEIDWNDKHQQLTMRINTGRLPQGNIQNEIKTVVLQNRRWDNAVINPRPTSSMGNELIWQYDRDLIFKAGNEYRKFEMLSCHLAGMHVDRLRWYDPYYHAEIMTDYPSRNYIYDEDQNGQSVFRNEYDTGNDTESDYFLTHFSLAMPELEGYDVYINGRWTYNNFVPAYKMTYNSSAGQYEASLLLKQGYYSYQYLALPVGKRSGALSLIEGDYYQTENEYTILVYYKRQGDRYYQLIGMKDFSYRP